jgi:hypothetical protein
MCILFLSWQLSVFGALSSRQIAAWTAIVPSSDLLEDHFNDRLEHFIHMSRLF